MLEWKTETPNLQHVADQHQFVIYDLQTKGRLFHLKQVQQKQ